MKVVCQIGYTQNIKISLVNAQNSNDGGIDYYEADIMIQTIDGQADFKLGSGQLYFNYNTDAFGTTAHGNNGFEVTADHGSDYLLGQTEGFISFYNISTKNDNLDSRVSWAFTQRVSSGAMTTMISSAPKLMVHIKFKYVTGGVNELPMVEFETDENLVGGCRDQFFIACGPFDTATNSLDCTTDNDPQNENFQFQDAIFDSGAAVLSINDKDKLGELSIYPIPTKELLYVDIDKKSDYLLIDMFGKAIINGSLERGENELQLRNYEAGVYFLRITNESNSITKKIVIE